MENLIKNWETRMNLYREEADKTKNRDNRIKAMTKFLIYRDCIKELKEQLRIANVSNMLCGSFDPDTTTSSATKCKCGREKWEHPKST